jgi:putative ABC transport system permease protein
MLKNYIKIGIRNILRQKSYSLINILGLALGMTTCILIMIWVNHELSYDKFNKDSDRIFRIYHELSMAGNPRSNPSGSAPMAQAISENCPEVESVTRIMNAGRYTVEYNNNFFIEENVLYVDSTFFDVFSYNLIKGDPKSVLTAPNSIVITEEIESKYFGNEESIGKILRFNDGNDFIITGVIENVPENSHMKFDMLSSFHTQFNNPVTDLNHWGRLGILTYFKITDNQQLASLKSKVDEMVNENLGDRLKAVGATLTFDFQPLLDIHLYSNFPDDIGPQGSISTVKLFIAIAVLVLIIACVNFINLSTARSSHRAKEVGMRKTIGAIRSELTFQFLIESIAISLLALIVSILLVEISLPTFNYLSSTNIAINYIEDIWIIPFLLIFASVIGILAGLYPAFYLSSFKVTEVIKGVSNTGHSKSNFRRILILFQFIVSIALIVGAATIYKQIDFMKSVDLGFNYENVLFLNNIVSLSEPTKLSLKQEINNLSDVESAGFSTTAPGLGDIPILNVRPEGQISDENQLLAQLATDSDFQKTIGLKLSKGRYFSDKLATDSSNSIIINELAANKFEWKNPIGKKISRTVMTAEGPIVETKTVVGVVENFHHTSLHQPLEPFLISNQFDQAMSPRRILSIKLNSDDFIASIESIKQKWEELTEGLPFSYQYAQDNFNEQYVSEEKLGKLAIGFSFLAIFIGCLGLFGMASYTTEQRTKEIGIRKALGSSVSGIVILLSKESIVLISLANIIAWPISYYVMSKWLSTFAYRIDMNFIIFVIASLVGLIISLITVSSQAIKAALANPVKSLKYE